MKYLVIAALFALFLLLVYSRIYPYLQTLKKILGVAKTIGTPPETSGRGSSNARVDGKLVRCVGCSTWVPAARAIGSGSLVYCSRECIEKSANSKERKLAG